MSFATILPMAFVMVAGPQILSAILLATSRRWRVNSGAFVLGAALSITLIVTAAFVLGVGAKHQGASHEALYITSLVLLAAAMVHTYVKRAQTHPPKWMGRVQTATPGTAFTMGFLLLGLFPTDILTSVAIGSYLAAHSDDWWQALPFVALTLLILSLPAIVLVVFGERADAALPKVRDWMTTDAWVVNEVVLAFFVVIVLSDLIG